LPSSSTTRLHAVRSEHVEAAIAEIQREGFPPAHAAKQYHVIVNGVPYPQKYVASLATRHASGEQLLPNEFSASQSRPVLAALGYEIHKVEPNEAITGEIIGELYFYGKEVFEGRITAKDALAELPMHSGSARDYLNNYRRLREGERYTRTMNAEASEYFLQQILKDRGQEGLHTALRAVEAHLQYHDGLGRGSQRQIHDLLAKYAALVVSEVSTTRIPDIARALNARAGAHPVGALQAIRAELKGTRRPGSDIFASKTIHNDWACHYGGRSELQFNIGLEEVGGEPVLRYGVAFSLVLSQSLPTIEPLIPKISRFNDFLRLYPDISEGMSMWHHVDGPRSDDRTPTMIIPELVTEGAFIFLGKRMPLTHINYETILALFDHLLPLYRYVEGGANAQPVTTQPDESFVFKSGCSTKLAGTQSTPAQRQLDINLRHNVLQQALHAKLSLQYGADNVGTERPSGAGTKVDVVVRHPDSYWFYEIKTACSSRACIREALGQLLEYAFWPGGQEASRLIIAGEAPLDKDGEDYLQRLRNQFGLPITYEQIKDVKA
jgi:hypothetical protein